MHPLSVGASLLAMVANDNAGNLMPRSVLKLIASKVRVISGATTDDWHQLYAKDPGGAQAYRLGRP
ncbi:hypothetical protein C1890_31680 [Pseudomonas sp. DP16D-R1]|nr:hypothetical protein C1890_31680 [Pseudomonas sp. DP16D-R1]